MFKCYFCVIFEMSDHSFFPLFWRTFWSFCLHCLHFLKLFFNSLIFFFIVWGLCLLSVVRDFFPPIVICSIISAYLILILVSCLLLFENLLLIFNECFPCTSHFEHSRHSILKSLSDCFMILILFGVIHVTSVDFIG